MPTLMLELASQSPPNPPVPSQHGSNTAYHPYARVLPSRHGSNAALNPPPCLLCHLPSSPFRIRSIGYGGLLAYTMNKSRKYAEWPSLPTGSKAKLVSILTMLWLWFKS
ncbi:hypothetical protein O181_083695 [Austropuccinia psidii MF-1]|uniref:Uncharacterized protein n=1 Tax=Austropuccinia psidii MF-1 TaxID=1389203 RepID=A0A9Q3FU84_9BASI|nr:hypothetical protein [Austropuccinia psidii MF-1]